MDDLIQKASILHEALPYIRRFHGQIFVIKYGGAAMAGADLSESFARDVVLMKYVGLNPVVVHGGGPQIDRALKQLNIEPARVEGLRVTDDRTMDVVQMVLGGKVNQDIVSLINGQGGRAVGLSGVDDGLLQAEKAPPATTASGQQVDLGRVGRIVEVRRELLLKLTSAAFIPVIASLAVGSDGKPLNVNADTAAGQIAAAIQAEKLVLMTDSPGVVDGQGALLHSLTASEIGRLQQSKVISGGMIPKVGCALQALEGGVKKCHIIDGRVRHAVLLEIFTDQGVGTEILQG
jgi:acetylglutamate kinase